MNGVDGYQADLRKKRELEVNLSHARQDLEGRKLFLTPTGADWKALGTSEDDRKIARDKIIADDPVSKQIAAQIRAIEVTLSSTNASIEVFEAARRAEEWDITRALADALKLRAEVRNPGQEAAKFAALWQANAEAADEVLGDQPPATEQAEALQADTFVEVFEEVADWGEPALATNPPGFDNFEIPF